MFFRAWLLSEHDKGMNYAHVKCILVNENRNNWTMMTGVNEVLTRSYIYKLVFLMNVDNCAWKLVAQAICVYTFSSAGWLALGSAIKVLVHTQRSLTRSSTPSCVKWKRQPSSICVYVTHAQNTWREMSTTLNLSHSGTPNRTNVRPSVAFRTENLAYKV